MVEKETPLSTEEPGIRTDLTYWQARQAIIDAAHSGRDEDLSILVQTYPDVAEQMKREVLNRSKKDPKRSK